MLHRGFKKNVGKSSENLKNGIYEGFMGLANKVVDVLNNVISSLESMLNTALDGINDLLSKLNESPLGKMLDFDFQVRNISFGRIPRFEDGGFPDRGSLFIANEAGPGNGWAHRKKTGGRKQRSNCRWYYGGRCKR
ncbi:MAG: hypothetical protein ACLURV_08785 [Gallintestinimicrobium sp.]